MSRFRVLICSAATLLAITTACGAKKAPVAAPQPPPVASTPAPTVPPTRPPAPPAPAVEPTPVPPEPPAIASGDLSALSIDEINKRESLKPAFFLYDSDQLDDAAQQALTANAQVLKKYGTWAITIEGHCDERGTAEYNLALGERRALAAKTYLVSLGIGADRIKTVSYGKEFPFDPGKDDAAFAKNRRAHFVLTGK